MANEQNLIPNSQRTPEELREMTRKGGIKSGQVRRQQKTFKEMFNSFANGKLQMPEMKAKLEQLGIQDEEMTNKTAMMIAMYAEAVKGNTKAFEIVRDTMGEKLDAEEIEERDHSIVVLPAKDIASSFCDANRSIDDRQYREYYFEGGRGSTKSSFISEKIIELLENNPRMCAVIMRKVKDTLKDSVFAQLEWAIDTIGETYPHIKADYKLTKSPLEITKLSTGQKIYFRRSR